MSVAAEHGNTERLLQTPAKTATPPVTLAQRQMNQALAPAVPLLTILRVQLALGRVPQMSIPMITIAPASPVIAVV